MRLRTDIEVLRVIAVTSVVVFHFYPSTLPLGYLGVDIFFVISGFLMASILAKPENNFRTYFMGFLAKRIGRLLPELLILLIGLLFIAIAVFPWFEIVNLFKEIIFSNNFISNYRYANTLDYFSDSSYSKWLLHTWSLSVEMQVYLILPILYYVFYKYLSLDRTHPNILLILGFFISCIIPLCIDIFNEFYLTLFRFWEFYGGALCFHISSNQEKKYKNIFTIQYLLIVTLILIIIFCGEYKQNTWINYIIVLITCCVLMTEAEYSTLSIYPIVKLTSAISYSLYLWHWPIAVFLYKLGIFDEGPYAAVSIAASAVVAYCSYQIYLYLRRRSTSIRTYLTVSLFISSILVFFLVLDKQKLLNISAKYGDYEFSSSPLRRQCHHYRPYDAASLKSCIIENGTLSNYNNKQVPLTAVLGDSHGVELSYVLSKAVLVKQYTFSNCPPRLEKTHSDPCLTRLAMALAEIVEDNSIKNVILSWHYISYMRRLDAKDRLALYNNLELIIARLIQANKNVILVKQIPELNNDIRDFYFRDYIRYQEIKNSFDRYSKKGLIQTQFSAWSQTLPSQVTIIDVDDIFCSNQGCRHTINKTPLYFDNNHLSLFGSELVASKLIDKLN